MILTSNILNSIVCAIYITEGGALTKHPYGIMSVKTDNARCTCEITVKHKFDKFCIAGGATEYQFIQFLGNRYCPVKSDPIGNRNWKRNMIKILKLKLKLNK